MDNPFFNLIKPYLTIIDNGQLFRQPFKWLYYLIGGLNILLPLYLLYQIIHLELFSYAEGMGIVALILGWLVIAVGGWVGFQLWWNRAVNVSEISETSSDFVAIPVFAHFIQTLGEWLGTSIAVFGTLVTLIIMLFMGDSLSSVPLVGKFGIFSIVFSIIYGFLILVISRVIAEQILALAAIANNTKK